MIAHYSHFVFDLDGTLVDSVPGIDAAAGAALNEVAPETALPSLRDFIGPPIRTMLQRALGWTDAARLDTLERAFRRHYDAGTWRESRPYPGVNETLRELHAKGGRLHVLTNKPLQATHCILDFLGWTPLLEAVICPQSSKPPFANKATAALDLRERRSLPKTTTLLVGDSTDDQEAAAAAGFNFAAAAWGYGDAAIRHPRCAVQSFPAILTHPLTPL
jgi:phosphoglycolate phosphatase